MANNNVTNFRGEIYFTPSGKLHIKDEPLSPEDFGDHNNLDYSFEQDFGNMRKSMSMNDITALREDLEFHDKKDVYHRHRKPSCAPLELSRTRFVSTAEAIYHFHRDTPVRFHTMRPQIFRSQRPNGPSGLTVPQSPMLRSKTRMRPSHILSQQEREEMELEEIRKHKIKANPIPKSVIEGTNLPEVPKKPITIPEPFKLTEIQKKAAESSDGNHQFKARPVPKHILEKPHIPVKLPVHVTKPISPKFRYKRTSSADQLRNDNLLLVKPQTQPKAEHHPRMGPLKPEPFSFEKRDEELKRCREERIKRQIEEERKQASLFKAQPIPGAVKKRIHCTAPKGSSITTSSSENKENVKFEAKPPVVLYKKQFKPVLQSVQPIIAAPFELTTEKRAAERERFDKQLKEKEEEQERMRLLKEKEQEEIEEREMAQLRAKLVHHAKPVPQAVSAPFVPERSVAPLTVPQTPQFVRRLKQN